MKKNCYQLLVVEDEELARKNLMRILSKQGYEVKGAANGQQAIDLLEKKEFDLILTDLKMKRVTGMDVLKKSKELYPLTEVIMITGYATVDSAVQAMKQGAYHYLGKPYKLDEVRKIVKEALLKRDLQLENRALKKKLSKHSRVPKFIGQSKDIRELLTIAHQIASSEANILIFGESGTGKELLAKIIHSQSQRSEGQFVAFNCGAFTEELMTNELFGHEPGAFTGANTLKKGLLEIAHKGIVFLDEIGDMPQSMQVKLLRVIQEGEVLRVGGTKPVPVNLRFIAATHRDLEDEVRQGNFRQDLYFRLNVITLKIPPLRERSNDIPLLANAFLNQKKKQLNKKITGFSQTALQLLQAYPWPGNVRELENVVERAVALATSEILDANLLPDYLQKLKVETLRQTPAQIPTLQENEREYILWVLRKCAGNKTQAAKIMGIDRVSLWRKLKRLHIQEQDI